MNFMMQYTRKNIKILNTSIEHLTSSTVGQIISGFPIPSGDPSSDLPADNEYANSLIHFSSSDPKEEN
jgi:hypothetical protein